jgi:hypothetical protein
MSRQAAAGRLTVAAVSGEGTSWAGLRAGTTFAPTLSRPTAFVYCEKIRHKLRSLTAVAFLIPPIASSLLQISHFYFSRGHLRTTYSQQFSGRASATPFRTPSRYTKRPWLLYFEAALVVFSLTGGVRCQMRIFATIRLAQQPS